MRTIRHGGVVLLVLLLTATLLRAAVPTGLAQVTSPAISTQTALPTAPPTVPSTVPHWENLARSATGQAIEFVQIGQGDRHVLVVGPLAGEQPEAVALAGQLAAHLARFPQRLVGTTVTIVREPNPDGRARRTPGNAHGVLLDRNFQTKGWRKVPSGDQLASGREPQSEAETKALAELMADVRPQCVVLLASTPGRPKVDFCGPADELAHKVGIETKLPAARHSSPPSGSLMTYAGVDRGIPTVRLHVPARSEPDANWHVYKRALLLAIGGAMDDDSPASTTPAVVPDEGERSTASSSLVPVQRASSSGAKPHAGAIGSQTKKDLAAKAAAQAIPVRTVSQASGAANPNTAPRLLHYEDFQRGLPLVPVTKLGPVLPSHPQGRLPQSPLPQLKSMPPKPTPPSQTQPQAQPPSRSPAPVSVQPQPTSPTSSQSRLQPLPPTTPLTPAASIPATAPTSNAVVPAKVSEASRIVRRLPSLDRIAPSASIPPRSRLPQEPIPLYPETGHD